MRQTQCLQDVEKDEHVKENIVYVVQQTLDISYYTPFHSRLPFEHLGQSSLCVSQVTFYSILELKQCQVFLNSIQHLSLDDATSTDKNIVIVWLKHIFISKFFSQHIQCILRTHI